MLYRLERSGFESCLVGGSVRDLLLGREPKDFDVATDARPNEVRRLFRNSRIIGRRFRLVHVYFRDGIVEVSTFRAGAERDAEEERGRLQAEARGLDRRGGRGSPTTSSRRRRMTGAER